MAFDPRCSVFRITHPVDPQKYGTGFVIHLDTAAPEGPAAYLLTCAHVVDELGKALKVRGKDAQLMAMGDQAGLDLAVIKVSLPGEALLRPALTTEGAKDDGVEAYGYLGDRLVPLMAKLNEPEYEKGKLGFYRFDLDPKEPDEVKKGYSGSPIVLRDKGEKVFAVANTRRASQGRHLVGACIPVWHLVKLWPEMPDELGAQLFGNAYWSLLQQVRPKTAAFTSSDYQQAFQRSCGPDELPAEYSLWGCAVSLQKFERDSNATDRLRGFLANLGIPEYTEKPATPVAPFPAGELYRQLIIRIVKREGSRRDDAGCRGGDRYRIETHLAQLEAAQASRCCANAGKECAPYIARELSTRKARQSEEERRSGLKELLEEEIPDSLASFGCHIPDLVQFIVPEDLLTDFIITNRIDQILVRGGAEPLAELHPTVFSGAKLSNADEDGRYLLDCLNKVSPLQGPVIGLHDPELPSPMRRQLKKAIVAVLCTPGSVNSLLQDVPKFVPFVLVSSEKAEAVVEMVKGLPCQYRLAHALHAQLGDKALPERLPIIANTPNVRIHFAETEEPSIPGN